MSRRRRVHKREILPDPIYSDIVITKFVNKMMFDGKKSTAQAIFYGALDELKTKITEEEPLTVFRKALENAKPQIEVRSRRVGGATYQVPVDVRPSRRVALAMKWLIDYSRERGEKDMGKRLAGELIDAYNNRGNAIKKKEDVHRMAEANRAFSHYNW
ncbi:MAG: 30S ribosomal protein S7 [Bdellovibrionales bacterium]|jgi:small subunit ribosomal protein S7|nr:30S ribosomal protein S7 [Bdellovibrionales bacterium]